MRCFYIAGSCAAGRANARRGFPSAVSRRSFSPTSASISCSTACTVMRVPREWHAAILCATAMGWFVPQTVNAVDNSECLACHSDKELTKKGADGKKISLFVDEAKYAASVHGRQNCTACHTDATETPHPDNFKAKPVSCAQCHEKQTDTYGDR